MMSNGWLTSFRNYNFNWGLSCEIFFDHQQNISTVILRHFFAWVGLTWPVTYWESCIHPLHQWAHSVSLEIGSQVGVSRPWNGVHKIKLTWILGALAVHTVSRSGDSGVDAPNGGRSSLCLRKERRANSPHVNRSLLTIFHRSFLPTQLNTKSPHHHIVRWPAPPTSQTTPISSPERTCRRFASGSHHYPAIPSCVYGQQPLIIRASFSLCFVRLAGPD
jgi:hypothetical protein